jgi:hypothetical protein
MAYAAKFRSAVTVAKMRFEHNVVLREIGNQHVVAGVELVYGEMGKTVRTRIDYRDPALF